MEMECGKKPAAHANISVRSLMELLQLFHLYHSDFKGEIICKKCAGEYGILECLGMHSLYLVRVYRTVCHEYLSLLTNIKIYISK